MDISLRSLPTTNPVTPSSGRHLSTSIATKRPNAELEFLKEAKKTPAERIHDAVLKRMGLSEDQYKALDPGQKTAIEEEIKAEIEKMIDAKQGGPSGNYVDLQA